MQVHLKKAARFVIFPLHSMMRWIQIKCLAAFTLAVTAACVPADKRRPGDLRGFVLPEGRPKPSFVMTDTEGGAFDFRAETTGYLAFLFLGYTNCPDVCPVHMANLGAVLATLPSSLSSRVRVVMVSVDPDRDTPERLRAWLDQFDRSFIGLRGDSTQLAELERNLSVAHAVVSDEDEDRSNGYLVGHASQVFVFSPDDSLRVFYTFGTRQSDWAHDIPLLLEGAADSQ